MEIDDVLKYINKGINIYLKLSYFNNNHWTIDKFNKNSVFRTDVKNFKTTARAKL